MTIKQIRKIGGCTATIDKLLLTYASLMEETKSMKLSPQEYYERRLKLTSLYRGQLLSLIEDFEKDKI